MSFDWPWALLALLLVPLVLGGYLLLQRRRMRYAMRFTNLDLLANVVDESPRWRRHVPPALFLVALAALLVGVARPQAILASPVEQATVVLAIDVSTSMEATDVQPNRLVAAREAAERFLEEIPDDMRVGLVTFSSQAQVVVAPTSDHVEVRNALQFLQPDGPPLAVILLSDGAPSPDTLDPLEAARTAQGDGVEVHTVALGTDQGTVTIDDGFGGEEVVPVPPDRETLSQIAQITGGTFADAPSEAAAERVYADLGSDIGYEKEKKDVTFAFAAGGAALMLLAAGLSVVWFNRLP